MSDATSDRDPFEVVAESFLARYRAGERPSIEDLAARHPSLAAPIRKLLPALVRVERDLSVDDGSGSGSKRDRPLLLPTPDKEWQLGDYRILREIGRGGMGVVYEAEQLSLGRRVALKVLPGHVAVDHAALERFRREAKAAARLHHTNIVPIFEVGRDGEVAYYAMQFIQGQGLDQVIDELARLHGVERKPRGTDSPRADAAGTVPGLRQPTLGPVAESLLSGRFATEGEAPSCDILPAAATGPAVSERLARDATHTSDVPLKDHEPASPGPTTAPGPGALLPGGTQVSTVQLSGRRAPFFRSLAQIGRQAAQGLAYAHASGIVHRDIKPSNILLDHSGVVWIADFGLAKGEDEGLTQSGDILGTLRYMAPERFRGQGDARADIYALGLTLYELLTLRPGFLSADRLRLIEQINTVEPRKPRSIDAWIPRDLETVVLKAIEKDPKARYQSAEAMAEDLRRFLADEPIRARQVGAAESYWRWARRNPVIAVMGGMLTAVLVVGFAVMAILWSRAERSASIAKSNELTAHSLARKEADARGEAQALATKEAKARGEARAQERVALDKAELLAEEDYVNRIDRAYREVQDDNVALAEDLLHGCPSERRGWEWHYVKRLCHPERLSVEVPAGSVSAIAFSPDGRVIATGSGGAHFRGRGGSTVEFWDRETGQRRTTLHRTENVIWGLAFSPDGTKLALGGTNPQVEVRDARTGDVRWSKHEPELPQAMSIAFSPDGKALAAGFGKYSQEEGFEVKIYEVETGRETVAFPGPKGGVNDLAFHPDGRQLAVTGSQVVEVWDVVGAPKKVQELRGHSKWVYGVAYSTDGKRLATCGWDRTIKLRDATSGEERLTIFGHEGFVLDLAFSPDSRSLVSTSEDRSVRLWEVPSGRPIGVLHGHADFVQAVAFAPDGRELASGGLDRTMKVWDRRSNLPVVFGGHTGWVGRLWYRRDGRRVITAPLDQLVAGEATMGWDPSTGDLDPELTGTDPGKLGDEYLPPAAFPPDWSPPPAVTSPDGKLIARIPLAGRDGRPMGDRSKDYASNSVEVLDARTGLDFHTLIGHTAEVVGLAFSPDGRRIATASWDRSIKLWDTATGREVFTLRGHTAGVLVVAFSPDGRRLVSGGIDYTARVWDATPLPAEILQAQDARYQRNREALAEQARAAEDAQRADNLARSGQWNLAAAAFGKFVEQEPDHMELRHFQIRALLEANDLAGAQRACNDLLKRSANTTNPIDAQNGAWSCVLTPDAVADVGALARLAELVLKAHPEQGRERSDRLRTLGAALYRAGRFAEAIRSLEESRQLHSGDGDPRGFAFLAMAHHRMGNRAEAKRWLDKLAAYRPKEGPDFSWDDVEIHILRREAEAVLFDAGFSADPFQGPGRR